MKKETWVKFKSTQEDLNPSGMLGLLKPQFFEDPELNTECGIYYKEVNGHHIILLQILDDVGGFCVSNMIPAVVSLLSSSLMVGNPPSRGDQVHLFIRRGRAVKRYRFKDKVESAMIEGEKFLVFQPGKTEDATVTGGDNSLEQTIIKCYGL